MRATMLNLLVVALLSALALTSCCPDPPDSPYILRDRVVVMFKEGVPRERIDEINAEIGTTVRDCICDKNYFILALPERVNLGEALCFYRSKPDVEFALYDTEVIDR
jgi:hypothetical protein